MHPLPVIAGLVPQVGFTRLGPFKRCRPRASSRSDAISIRVAQWCLPKRGHRDSALRAGPVMTGVLFGLLCIAPARADDVADFYKGKAITLTVSASAGGGYDTLARTVARFLGKHVPGQPIVIVRNMAGAGGMAATNFLYGTADKDGSHIGLLQNNAAFEPLLGTKEARYDATKFN